MANTTGAPRTYNVERGCFICGALAGQARVYWEVSYMLWCPDCYTIQFPIHVATAIFCCGNTPRRPIVAANQSYRLEVEAKTIRCSAERGSHQDTNLMTQYTNGIRFPLYTKMWEYPDGTKLSTVHMMDGRYAAIGPRFNTPRGLEDFTVKEEPSEYSDSQDESSDTEST